MNILFRADSSSSIGIGHIMRDLVLAKQFKNSNIDFVSLNLDGNINQNIINSGHGLIILNSNSVKELISIILSKEIDLLIIDHYNIDYSFEKEIKDSTNVKILAFDDTYEQHCCDYLINQNIHAKKSKYQNLIDRKCILFCGIEYALLREEFTQLKASQSFLNPEEINILVTLGGADSKNMTMVILDVLNQIVDIKYKANIVIGKANQHLSIIQKVIEHNNKFKLIVDAKNMATLMNNSDLAIMAGGTTTIEALYLKLPFVTIMTAYNQKENIVVLEKMGLSANIGSFDAFNKNDMACSLRVILKKLHLQKYLEKVKNIKIATSSIGKYFLAADKR